MSKACADLPKQTLFSTNPKTSEPFLSVTQAESLIHYHLIHHAPYLVTVDTDRADIVQSILTQMCVSAFDPKLSSPKTFAILIIKSKCGNLNKINYLKRNTISDTLDENGKVKMIGRDQRFGVRPTMFQEMITVKDDSVVSSLDIKPDLVTPLDYLLAKEAVAEFEKQNDLRESKGKRRRDRPVGFTIGSPDQKLPDSDKKKKCTKCHKSKLLRVDYYKKYGAKGGYFSACKACAKIVSTKNKKASSKRHV